LASQHPYWKDAQTLMARRRGDELKKKKQVNFNLKYQKRHKTISELRNP
jgi:hypothetical protein